MQIAETNMTSTAEGKANRLPPRYMERWQGEFEERIASELRPAIRILDVGGGRQPAVPVEKRPPDCFYAGLDLSAAELAAAPKDAYTETYVGDILQLRPDLVEQFDLVVSWQVFEHVKPLDSALENVRSYLCTSGRFISQFSGTFSAFGLANQVVPSAVGPWLLKRFLGRDPATVFPAYYHHCWYSAIRSSMSGWSEVEVVSRYGAAGYYRFSALLQRLYLAYENWAADGNHRNLATHYLVDARR